MHETSTLLHHTPSSAPGQIHRPAPEVVVTIAGEIDMLTAPTLRERLGQAMGPRGTVVVVDASAVTFIDCAGLRELLAAHTRLAVSGRTLVVRSPSRPVAELLELTGLTVTFAAAPVAGKVDEAGESRAARV